MSSEEYKQINSRLDRIEQLTLIGVKNVLSLEETAALTGFSVGHLYRLTSQKQIPHFKKNRKLYFLKSDIEAFVPIYPRKAVALSAKTEFSSTSFLF